MSADRAKACAFCGGQARFVQRGIGICETDMRAIVSTWNAHKAAEHGVRAADPNALFRPSWERRSA